MFQRTHADGFPSGEVAAASPAVTPFIVRYGDQHRAVYALALLPAYDAAARLNTRGHWQSDVLVDAAIGTAVGIWIARRKSRWSCAGYPAASARVMCTTSSHGR